MRISRINKIIHFTQFFRLDDLNAVLYVDLFSTKHPQKRLMIPDLLGQLRDTEERYQLLCIVDSVLHITVVTLYIYVSSIAR